MLQRARRDGTPNLMQLRLSWPDDPLQKALFGERSVAELCKGFGISSSEAALTVVDCAIFKQSSGAAVGNAFKHLRKCIDVLPISSADCARGFSQMNLYHTSGRNRLLVNSANDLLMVGINGPPLEALDPSKYVISWLKPSHHGALDKATGLPKKAPIVKPSAQLFM